ncbi:MAG: hypothetical protein HY606_10105 [Planctomycetes bacterium]|nr:hypothetical protein [Planctomycetota bacterium]
MPDLKLTKELIFGEEVLNNICKVFELCFKLTIPLSGAKPGVILASRKLSEPKIITNAYDLIQELELDNIFQNTILSMIKDTVNKIRLTVGEGYSLFVIMSYCLFKAFLKRRHLIENNLKFFKHLENINNELLESLAAESKAFIISEDSRKLLNKFNNLIKTELFAEIIEKMSQCAVLKVEEGDAINEYIDYKKGYIYERGYITSHFVNNPVEATCVLDNPAIVVVDDTLSSVKDVYEFLTRFRDLKKPLLLFVKEITSDPIATFVVNKIQGGLESCIVKLPGSELRKNHIIEELECITGTKAVRFGLPLNKLDMANLGTARLCIVAKEETRIYVDKFGEDYNRLNSLLSRLLSSHELTLSEKEDVQERLLRLHCNITTLVAGGYSKREISFKAATYRSMLIVIRNSIKEGIIENCFVKLCEAADKSTKNNKEYRFISEAFEMVQNLISNRFDDIPVESATTFKFIMNASISFFKTLALSECIVALKKQEKDPYIPPGIENIDRVRRGMV